MTIDYEARTITKPWAIYSDLSGVTNVGGNNGGYATELEAVYSLVCRLEGERDRTASLLRVAKRRHRMLTSLAASETDHDD